MTPIADIPSSHGDAVIEAVTRQLSEQLTENHVSTGTLVTAVLSTLSEMIPGLWVLALMKRDPSSSRVFVADRTRPELATWVEAFLATAYHPGEAETTGLSQRVIETGEAMVKPRLNREESLSLFTPTGQAYIRSHPLPVEIESAGAAVMPMRTFGATTGTLALFQLEDENMLSEADTIWMQRVADRTALGVELVELYQLASERESRLAAVNAVALMMTSSADLRPVLDLALEHLRACLNVDSADVLVANENRQLIRAASAGFRTTSIPAENFTLPEEAWILGAPKMRSQLEEMFTAGHSPRRSHFVREGFQAYRCIPLTIQSTVVGAIELFSRSAIELDREGEEFLQEMAALVAIAIGRPTSPSHHRMEPAGRDRLYAPSPDFSQREVQILKLLVVGRTNQEIGEALNLSKNTVKFNIRRMLDKVDVANRTELAARAAESDWLKTPE